MPVLHFWYEFASTYSYLTATRIEDRCRAAGVDLIWRPFLLGPIFHAQGWDTSPFNIYEAKGRYMWRDLERRAAAQGLPNIHRPDPFPQNSLLAARIATIGVGTGWGPDFTRAVYAAQFAEGQSISAPETLIALLDGLGLDGSQMIQRAQTDDSVKNGLRAATEAAQSQGLFGAPSFTTEDGELFWGDDQLEDAIDWALRVKG
ncbi:2-hydroxychromene-2-carboxylate isomerase [Ruegeria sp. 2205SS24-7]|uniref:2-hydroxychromene-2-carboxylate isomerase n=1 Tax=Ruegeria discodermiae TaxID=3064389 RepID=UPI00274220A1|nr:2-hydroxychromene-2-carboxylate isomerase [Ruegeria sp. 2205SS24-7]MDP5219153.1 2-hydroxychromene-2-carboxylate isomerase [Ruegeria sp. 2205SS24-7]